MHIFTNCIKVFFISKHNKSNAPTTVTLVIRAFKIHAIPATEAPETFITGDVTVNISAALQMYASLSSCSLLFEFPGFFC